MEYDEQDSSVTYHSDKPTGPTAGSETTDALEFLARLTSHIPDKGQVLQRYYGFYSSHRRGTRRKANGDAVEQPLVMVDPEPENRPHPRAPATYTNLTPTHSAAETLEVRR